MAVLRRLDRLTQEEAQVTVAQTLEVVQGLVSNMKVVMDSELDLKRFVYFLIFISLSRRKDLNRRYLSSSSCHARGDRKHTQNATSVFFRPILLLQAEII
jgi:hypothetical protein